VGRGPWRLFWDRFQEERLAMASLGFIVVVVLMAVAAPLAAAITGHGPNELFLREMTDEFGLPRGPNAEFWFGADSSGRDVFVRIFYGARVSLLVGLIATAIALVVGTVLGVIAGYFGGRIDTLISRTAEIMLSMPVLLFAVGITAACSATKDGCLNGTLSPGLPLVIAIIALFTWPLVTRLVRGNTLSLREREFVEAGISLGATHRRIMFRHILPNLLSPLIVYATLLIPAAILLEAYLSFLGLGVASGTPSWGSMVAESLDIFEVAWWLMLFPGVVLLLTVLAFNLLGDGLRDALDPRASR
jgi:ABC-type dipeptide/oligopeptide/nickel transport system permease subunit